MRDRRRKRGVCINGEAFVLLDGWRIQVEQFLEGGTRCQFRAPNAELVERLVAEVKLDPDAHGPAVRGGRCQRCWDAKLDAEANARAEAAAARAAAAAAPSAPAPTDGAPQPTPAPGGGRRRRAPTAQGAFAWAA